MRSAPQRFQDRSTARPEAAEQIESLGARAVRLDVEVEPENAYARELAEDQQTRQRELLTPHVADSDVVITTAAVPGRQAPVLITHQMVHRMRAGAVIVDAAVESGGNCEVSYAGERRVHGNGVIICGPTDLPSGSLRTRARCTPATCSHCCSG